MNNTRTKLKKNINQVQHQGQAITVLQISDKKENKEEG